MVRAQVPVMLTDKIYQGSGVIDVLKDISPGAFQQYVGPNGTLSLGVDLNENASGNETSDSIGVAIKQLELQVTTTAGSYNFRDFFTSTSALIRESGSTEARTFHTLFGKGGSSALTGSTSGFNLGQLDDVIQIRDVAFQGTLLSARVNVQLLETAATRTQGNETFFDFSGGFEDFALLGAGDAAVLEAANFGVAASPEGIAFNSADTTPGAPTPPLWLLGVLGVILARRGRQ